MTGTIRVMGRTAAGRHLKKAPKVQGCILSATVRREAELSDPEPVHGPAVGIDVGLKSLCHRRAGEWDGDEASSPPAAAPTPAAVAAAA